MLSKPTMKLNRYNESSFENLGSCIVYLYHGNKKYRVLCEVAKSKGHMILGRKQALVMGYINFPEMLQPTMIGESVKSLAEERVRSIDCPRVPSVQESSIPEVPVIQEHTQQKIPIYGKTHSLPTTKDYLGKEYADVFHGMGTLPGGLIEFS